MESEMAPIAFPDPEVDANGRQFWGPLEGAAERGDGNCAGPAFALRTPAQQFLKGEIMSANVRQRARYCWMASSSSEAEQASYDCPVFLIGRHWVLAGHHDGSKFCRRNSQGRGRSSARRNDHESDAAAQIEGIFLVRNLLRAGCRNSPAVFPET
jgi:hypothetical protein